LFYREDSLLGIYHKLKEAGTPSDFPNVMADVQHKILLNAFKGFPSVWNVACKLGDVSDFKTHHRKWLSEAFAEGGLKKTPGGPYKAFVMKDRGYGITAATLGGTFGLTRETVINDDMDAFRNVPASLGRAMARQIAKDYVAVIEGNDAAYDGSALFGARGSVSNFSFTELTADTAGIAALQAATKAIAVARDPDANEIMGLQAKYLLVSPSKAEVASWLLSSLALVGGATTNGLQLNPLQNPALSRKLELIVEPMLENNFPNRWYVLADPNVAPAVEIAFLNGVKEPELFVEESKAISAAGGGRDRFGYDYDDVNFKTRWDYGVKAGFYQGIFKGGN
jgi:hypothetical protein